MLKTLYGRSVSGSQLKEVIGKEEGARWVWRREEHPFIPFSGRSSIREDVPSKQRVEGRSE
jgi:hypothetical protein